ncbi:hypothetical protein SmJEL517_g03141 [Synchytrium microbalum]|uniref:DUF300-domain-containing protein n=1 Tax=Synchytrium microbalum TaxID=1806994 RepID=A0A507C3H7_9FUNG|nr:uncharacterized protein SmJEL517_g03141 [Synchytrium microbalum]TPX34222.1 hypothetical protein SmJEL517_g03141 [Synchytrium microbalum]
MSDNTTTVIDECSAATGPSFDPSSPDFLLVSQMWLVTVIFSILSTLLSFYLVYRHFQYYFKPNYQRHIVRILLMVPIYTICSCLSFRFFNNSIWFDIVRDGYEAFVIYSFFHLLMDYLGPDFETRHQRLINKPSRTCLFPFICFKYSPRGHAFLINCRVLVLQYVVVRPCMTVLALILQSFEVLCPNSSSPLHGEFWISWINMFSVTIAMYGLLEFYLVIHHDIAEHKPFYKIVAVKLVVFFSFWQSIVLSLLQSTGVLSSTALSADSFSDLIQSFLVCAEMVIAAFLHIRAFSHHEFVPSPAQKTPIWAGMKDALWPKDIVSDLRAAPIDVRQQARRRREKRATRKLAAMNADDFADDISLNNIDVEYGRTGDDSDDDSDAASVKVGSVKSPTRAQSPMKTSRLATGPVVENGLFGGTAGQSPLAVQPPIVAPASPADMQTFLFDNTAEDEGDDNEEDEDDHKQ